ncbi:MAG: methyltransferase domain-containing protein [Hyphomonadaceae bacterium]
MASGDGAALYAACEPSTGLTRPRLIAIDIAPAAIKTALSRTPEAIGVVADAAALPLQDGSANVAASQFGLEYAGICAFKEAARVLSEGGVFCAISHLKGGLIEAECGASASLLDQVFQSGLLERARASLEASYSYPREAAKEAIQSSPIELAYLESAKRAFDLLSSAPESMTRHSLRLFVKELVQLMVRRLAYEPSEAIAWLDRYAASLTAAAARMRAMQAAALGENQMQSIAEIFGAQGAASFLAAKVSFTAASAPSAWRIQAQL